MKNNSIPAAPPCTLFLFGANGDLVKRLLMPALYNLSRDGLLDRNLRIIGVDHNAASAQAFADRLHAFMRQREQGGEGADRQLDDKVWARLAKRLDYLTGDFLDPATYAAIAARVSKTSHGNAIFYLATAPRFFPEVARRLGEAGLLDESQGGFRRLVVEKPFGTDLASAEALNACLLKVMSERQIYRIDHYLGKETVQNLLALRFGNILFEPLWRREWISDVQITIAEKIGVGNRLGYYDNSGALRDMLQNHLLQLLCIVAMEPPTSIAPDAVRDAKLQVLRSLKRFTPTTLSQNIIRGQYRAGYIDGQQVPGYREEPDAPKSSRTETFVAMKAEIDTWRWAGVPFYLRTGKRMADRLAEIVVRFKPIPHSIFNQPTSSFQPNSLVIRLQPDEGLSMNLMAKTPGDSMRLKQAELELDFREQFKAPRMEAYERLLLDVLRGQLTLFMRGDELEAAWEWVEPILEHWEQDDSAPAPYTSGTWGPAAASALIGRDGLQWREEALPED